MLKALISKADYDKLPDAIKAHYTAVSKDDDTDYTLSVDDKSYSTKLKEFRDNNVTLTKRQEELLATAEKFKDIDLEKYSRAMEELSKIDELEDAEMLKKGKFPQVMEKRTQKLRDDYEKTLKQLTTERDNAKTEAQKLREDHHGLLIDTTVQSQLGEIGVVRKNAMAHLLHLGRQTFTVGDEGQVVAREGQQNSKGEPLTFKDWGEHLLKEHEFLFESAGGSGSGGGKKDVVVKKGGVTMVPNNPLAIGMNAEGIAKGTHVVARE